MTGPRPASDRSRGAPILMYHEVAEPDRIDAIAQRIQRGYIATVAEFEAQIAWLHANGFRAVSLSTVVDALVAGTELPGDCVVISFDDGFVGNHEFALPILAKYGATATFFVVTNKIGQPGMMNWSQLEDLVRAGCEVQSHTANHPLLSTLDEQETVAELKDSQAAIEARLGTRCDLLSLPNGDTNPRLAAVAISLGYRALCGSSFGFNDAGPFSGLPLERIAIKGGLSLPAFERIVRRDASLTRSLRRRAAFKAAIVGLLGKKRYDRVYNRLFGVAEQDHRRTQ